MFRGKFPVLVSLALVVGVIATVLSIFAAGSPGSRAATAASQINGDKAILVEDRNSPPTPTAPEGMPAIAPHLHEVPSFTIADVQNEIKKNGFAGAANGAHYVVAKIVFTQAKNAPLYMSGARVSLPPDMVICIVVFKGPIALNASAPITTAGTGYEIYNATTGNFLEWAASRD